MPRFEHFGGFLGGGGGGLQVFLIGDVTLNNHKKFLQYKNRLQHLVLEARHFISIITHTHRQQ